jgi:hypothetical protein
MKRKSTTIVGYGMMLLALLGSSIQSQSAEVMTPVQKVLVNPSAFHRHDVVLQGALKLVGRWEGKSAIGGSTCGPIFTLDDGTGEILVIYIIRCDQTEAGRVEAMAGGRAIVYATIDSFTVYIHADGSESRIKAMATKIQREE